MTLEIGSDGPDPDRAFGEVHRYQALELDDGQWPLVFSRFDRPPTMSELESYISKFSLVWRRKQSYLSIIYIKSYSRDQAVLRRIVRWMKESEAMARQFSMGSVLVVESAGFRFILSSLFLLKPMPVPYHVCGSFADAVEFARKQAASRGVTLPQSRRPWADMP